MNRKRLFDRNPYPDQIPLFEKVLYEFRRALEGHTDQFLYNLDYYLADMPEVRRSIAERGRRTVFELARAYHWRTNVHYLVDSLSDTYFALFQALEDFVVVGIDMESLGYPTALYTRNLEVLSYLYHNRMVDPYVDMSRVFQALTGPKTAISLYNANFVAARLDMHDYNAGKPIFRVLIPRSNLDIGGGKRYVIIPVPFMYRIEELIFDLFADKPFEFTKTTTRGQVVGVAAVNPQVVAQVYKDYEKDLIVSKVRRFRPGYDVLQQKFLAYDLEASIYSVGVASFRPEMLDKLVPAKKIDTSHHHIDFRDLRGVFKTRIRNAKAEQLDKLKYLDLSGFSKMKDKIEAILMTAEKEPDARLYWLMRNNPEVFGDIEEALNTRKKVTPKFLKNFKPLDLSVHPMERRDVLQKALKEGVLKFTTRGKTGFIFEAVGSNNPKVLMRVYGKDYVKRFESIRNRVYYLKEMLDKEIKSPADLDRVWVEYGLEGYVDKDLFFAGKNDLGFTREALNAFLQRTVDYGRRKNEFYNLITYRNLYASHRDEYYGTLDVLGIFSAEYAEIE